MKTLLLSFFSAVTLVLSAALPDNETFTDWNTAKKLPAGWSLLARSDRPNTVQKNSSGILLNGMIISAPYPYAAGARDVKITLKTKNVKKFLKVYLFYYTKPEDKHFNQVGQAFDLKKSDGDTYTTTLPYSVRGHKYYRVVLDGEGAEIDSIIFEPLKKNTVKNIPSVIPVIYQKQAPGIRKISLNEWKNSFTFINPFRSTMQHINFIDDESVSMQTDGKNIYLLFSTKNYRSGKRSARDSEVFKDSSVEMVFQPAKQDRQFHLILNWDGAVFDEEIAVGQKFTNWNCPGLVSGVLKQNGKAYLAVSIPFRSLHIDPDAGWLMNICRNRPEFSEFASMNGGGYFRNLMQTNVIRDMESCTVEVNKKGNTFLFRAAGKDTEMRISEHGGFNFTGKKKIGSGTAEIAAVRQDLTGGIFEFALTKNGKRFFRMDVQFGKMSLQKAAKETLAQFVYYPIQKKVGIIFQTLSFKQMRELARVECQIGNDKVVLDKFTANRGVLVAQKPYSIPADGTYQWKLKVITKDGKVIEENSGSFTTRKNFEWLGNKLGKDRIVIPPFTKMTVNGNTVGCTMRDTTFGPDGFPSSIIAAGKEVLSSPVKMYYIDAKGKEIPFEGQGFKITSKADDRVEMRASSRGGTLKTNMTSWMEYDGVFYYTMNLKADKPTAVRKLYLEVPVDQGDLFHAVGASFRNDVLFWRTKELPGNGVVWKSSQYPVRSGITGSFLPSVWLGTFRNGISFFAESDRNWINSRKSDCIELIRRNGKMVLRINFVSKKATLKGQRKLEFGFVATPLKKRQMVGADHNFLWTTSFARTFFNKGLIAIDPFITNIMLNPNRKNSYVAYTAGQEYIEGDPEFKMFAVEMDKEYKPTFNPWEIPQIPFRNGGMDYDDYTSRTVIWNSYRVDFMLWRLNQILSQTDVDGIYQDNSYATFGTNMLLNDQTFLREDGKVQGIYHFLMQREYLKRCAVLAWKHNKRFPRVVLHNTGAMMPAAFAFVDGFMDGEMDVTKYYSEFPMAWNDIMLGVDWGLIPGRLTMIGPKAKDQNRALFSVFKLYDMYFWITHSGFDHKLYAKLKQAEKNFGMKQGETTFFGYWQKNNPVRFTGNTPLLASCYSRKDGSLLIYVSNTTSKPASGTLKFDRNMSLLNVESGKNISPVITLPKEDFIAILATPQK